MSLDLTLKNSEFNFNVSGSSENRVFKFGEFLLDAAHRLLYRDGTQVSLTPKAVETLIALVECQGEVISKDELMEKIWADTTVEESNLAQYLHVLRKTLGNTTDGKPYIETLKRRGYRFNGLVHVVENEKNASARPDPYENSGLDQGKPPAFTDRHSAPMPSRGSVRAFGNVAAARETESRVSVERSANIYSVSDWRREPVPDTPTRPCSDAGDHGKAPARPKWLSPVVLAVLIAGFAGIVFGFYKIFTNRPNAGNRAVPFFGSNMTRLTTTGRSKHVAISPDGKYIAHVTSDNGGDSLTVRQVAVANDTRVAGPTLSDLVWVTFSPDGNFVYYLALERDKGETELFRVPIMGGPIVKIAHDVGAPTFSPDGTKLAYMVQNQEESRLIIAEADGPSDAMLMTRNAPDHLKPNEVVLASRREPDHLNMYWIAPAWSVDGKSVAFPVNESDANGRYETLMAVDVETRVERRLTDARWQQVGQPRWLPDGILVSASEKSTAPKQLWYISLPDGAAARITRDLNDYQNISLSSDSGLLAVIEDHAVSNIWTGDEQMSTAKQIMSEAGRFNEIIWLPDGRLAYTSNAGGSSEIWTMNADGTNPRQLTVGANARLGLTLTADMRQLVFSAEREGKNNLWRINIDGSNLTHLTNGSGEYYPQCTPDGRWIIYQSGGNFPTLWKMPTDGGEATAITKTTASRPSLSPDGKFVAYHYLDSGIERSKWGIGIIRLEDGKFVKRFDLPQTVVERLVKWTRDGNGIAFLNSPEGVPNVWVQPLEGGGPRPLTSFSSDDIIAFNWNADGSRLAVIRGVVTSDVLLMDRISGQ